MPFSVLKKRRGFTLIELVVVIVLLGITAVTFTTLITGSVRGYLDTANRQDSAAVARIALDRIARELREAVPQSVRVSGGCLQFLPIAASTVYTSFSVNATSISVIDFAPPAGNGYYAVAYAVNSSEVYDATSSTVALKSISNFGAVVSGVRTLILASGFSTPRNSPGERLYVASTPVSYCFEGTELARYTDGLVPTQPTTSAAGLNNRAVLIDKLSAGTGSSFRYAAGNWQNNALVTIMLTISQANGETLQFDHEVWLRNVQ